MRLITLTVIALLLAGCEEPLVSKLEPVSEAKAASAVPVVEAAAEPEAVPEPPAKKRKPLNYNRCQKINRQFIQCGWKCIHRGGGVGSCVNACNHFLNKKGYRCLHKWGPGFG
jgi:hypothetical protein